MTAKNCDCGADDKKVVIERVDFVRHIADAYRAGLDEGLRRKDEVSRDA